LRVPAGPLVEALRDEPPPDDEELFDLLPEDERFDAPDEERLPPVLFESPESFDEREPVALELFAVADRPPPADLEELADFWVDEDDDLLRLAGLDEPLEELDFDRLPPLLEREAAPFPLVDLDADDRPPTDEAIVSAAAPIAPAAAPVAAPLIISPATSITLSTMSVVELFDLDDLLRDELDEEEPLLREPPE
jgi:hypothetical protein